MPPIDPQKKLFFFEPKHPFAEDRDRNGIKVSKNRQTLLDRIGPLRPEVRYALIRMALKSRSVEYFQQIFGVITERCLSLRKITISYPDISEEEFDNNSTTIRSAMRGLGVRVKVRNGSKRMARFDAKRLTSDRIKRRNDRRILHYIENSCDPSIGLSIADFGSKGRGLMATESIRKNVFICEYSGDWIDHYLAKYREERYREEGHKHCYQFYFRWEGRECCIDATEETNRFGRIINHSRKDPNCRPELTVVNGCPHIVFIATRDIQKNEEIVYDYGEWDKEAIRANAWLAST